jgi:hypothetical protein
MPESRTIGAWIGVNWYYAGLTAAAFLLLMLPLLWTSWTLPLIVVFLQLPAYMVHQVEEHHQDCFRTFVNAHLAGGRDALTTPAVLVVNLLGVWGVDLAAIYLGYFLHVGLGLIAIYLALVNAVLHLAGSAVLRAYNPGVITALLLLLPLGGWGWWLLVRSEACTVWDHVFGLGIAIAIHLATILHVRYRTAKLSRATSAI